MAGERPGDKRVRQVQHRQQHRGRQVDCLADRPEARRAAQREADEAAGEHERERQGDADAEADESADREGPPPAHRLHAGLPSRGQLTSSMRSTVRRASSATSGSISMGYCIFSSEATVFAAVVFFMFGQTVCGTT